MGKQEDRIDDETNSDHESARDSAADDKRPPSTATKEHKAKPETPEAAETDELMDDRFQATDN